MRKPDDDPTPLAPAEVGLGGLPDVRDGLTRLERVILVELDRAQRERAGRHVPTALLYGRVLERLDVGVSEFRAALRRLLGA